MASRYRPYEYIARVSFFNYDTNRHGIFTSLSFTLVLPKTENDPPESTDIKFAIWTYLSQNTNPLKDKDFSVKVTPIDKTDPNLPEYLPEEGDYYLRVDLSIANKCLW